MIDNRSKMLPIMYIGNIFQRHPEWVDRLYGTGIIWTKENSIQMVPDVAAKRMLRLNPDCYRIAETSDVKAGLSKVKVKPASTESVEQMIAGLNDVTVLKNFAMSLDNSKEFDEDIALDDLKEQIIIMVREKEAKAVEGHSVDINLLEREGKGTAARLATEEKEEFDSSVAKQNLLNSINEMDNKDLLIDFAMSTPSLTNVSIDKRQTVAKIKESIIGGLRAAGQVY